MRDEDDSVSIISYIDLVRAIHFRRNRFIVLLSVQDKTVIYIPAQAVVACY